MTDPTVSPDTRICTRSVMSSVDLALLGQGPVRVLRALRAPTLVDHRLHHAGLGPLVGLERGTHQMGGPGREAGEVRAPLDPTDRGAWWPQDRPCARG